VPCDRSPICFGLDRTTDEHSLALLLARFADGALLHTLLPRLTDSEIETTVHCLTKLMKKHLSHREYHQLFLGQPDESRETPL
jgi:hypothetical protein